jgi:iron complex outermembrane recepter protein
VEVLRGPQGTLFGRNTTGGAINIINNTPTDQFSGFVKAGGGNYGSVETLGEINVPIIDDQLDARLYVNHNEHSGYGENVNLNRDAGNMTQNTVRGSVKLAPHDSIWNLVVAAGYSNRSYNNDIYHLLAYNPKTLTNSAGFAAFQEGIDQSFYDTTQNQPAYVHLKTWNSSATLTVDLGAVTFKSISAAAGISGASLDDLDGTAYDADNYAQTSSFRQRSQEFQFSGRVGSLQWIAGAFYFQEHTNVFQDNIIRVPVVFPLLSTDAGVHTSVAGFTQANYNLTDKLRVTAGVRVTEDYRRETVTDFHGGSCFLAGGPPGCLLSPSTSFGYPSYTLDLDYQWTPEIMVYGKTSMAHRSGSFNVSTANLLPYGPEKVTDYEAGIKSEWLDHRLRLNADGYFTFYENMQRSVILPASPVAGGGVFTQSVGKAHIPGIEAELTVIPVENLELSASAGLLWPKYVDFHDSSGDLSHQPFIFVSKQNYNLSATYTLPVSYGSYMLHTDYGYQSQMWFSPPQPAVESPQVISLLRQPGYGLLNAQLTLKLGAPQWLPLEFSVWGKNLAGKQYHKLDIDIYTSLGYIPGLPGDPRTFGANVTYRF